MAAKKRGGRRPRAGRPPDLTELQRLQIGAGIHWRLVRRTRALWRRSIDAKLAEDDLPQMWARLDATPRHNRRRVSRPALEAHLADIQAAIEEGLLKGERFIPAPKRTRHGIRPAIVRSVARAASRLFRKEVKYRTAERCLEEYRDLQARVDAALSVRD